MSETEDLKEWIKIHFSDYDKSRFDLYMKEKKAYSQGVQYIEDKFPDLPEHLFINLKHESGMAYVAKENRYLMDYAVHMFRQIESIFNELFDLNKGLGEVEINRRKNTLQKMFDLIQNNGISEQNYEITSNSDFLVCFSKDAKGKVVKQQGFKKGERIGVARSITGDEIVAKTKNHSWYFTNDNLLYYYSKRITFKTFEYVSALNSLLTNGKHMPFGNQNDVFKHSLYFFKGDSLSVSKPVSCLVKKPQLNSFVSIKHYRDLGQHNIASKKSLYDTFLNLSSKKGIEKEDSKYLNFPESIMDGDYYQRYIDMVISVYAELYKVDYDLDLFHGIDTAQT